MSTSRSSAPIAGRARALQALRDVAALTEAELDVVRDRFVLRTVGRRERYLDAGDRNNGLGFLEEGLMRSTSVTADGDEVTSGFIEPSTFFSDLGSYLDGSPSGRTLEAVTPCRVWALRPEALEDARRAIPRWALFEHVYISQMLRAKTDFQRSIINSNTDDAYAAFAEQYPYAASHAPRYQVASFLGMSPYTLSRKPR